MHTQQTAPDLLDKTKLLAALVALKKGDFSVRLPLDWTGMDGKIADAFNEVVELNERTAAEHERLSRVVGKEGKITERASIGHVSGSWASSVSFLNTLISDLVHPISETARVIGAVARGDLQQNMELEIDRRPLEGEFLRTARTMNTMVSQLGSFASEVTRVAHEVGTEGNLGGQAQVTGVAGTWKDLTNSVNLMASNLTSQVRNIADVATAIANGDLSKKITVDVKGEILELKITINTMVDQLSSFASEVTRVAREVGTQGKLGGQAEVKGVAGTWKDLTDNVNSMAGNLTSQVRNIAEVTKAVAAGDLSKKITVDVKGEILELKNTINTMVDQLNSFASEVTRVAREVGTEGKLGGQAQVEGVAGTWKDLTANVNFMAGNLTGQVRNIAEVTKAVAAGNLSKKITVDVKGEILELKNTINTMVDQLNSFASEVTRVAREVGTEGKLGGQAEVKGVAGTWKDLTDNVNSMAGNLTAQVRNIAAVTTAVATGDLSKKITVDVKGEILELKNTINTMVDQLNSFASEVTRVAREVGTEGKLGGQAQVEGVAGTWKDLTENVNSMASNLTAQVRNIAAVTTAVATGDLSKKITVDVKGEILELKNTINTMVDQLSSFASEVTRVAREVGTEGKLGGQADVKGVAGTWKDLTDNVNSMAGNLTGQVRNIAEVATAIASGDLSRKITVDVKGEILELKNTVNTMVDQLSSFASEVTRVAREVGTEGKLGGQAEVKGVAGTWKDLTDNVNRLAANLTTQVRAIADVATAVTKGDLTRFIKVDAQGEVAALKDNINEMIRKLKETTLENSQQDWLKTNLAKFSRMLQGQKDRLTVGKLILSELAPVVTAQQAVFYTTEIPPEGKATAEPTLKLLASYAHHDRRKVELKFGEGLIGQCAVEKKKVLLANVPDGYVKISSGLGEATPKNVAVLPVLFEGAVKAVIELASLDRFSPTHVAFLEQLMETIGIVLHTIEANMRTENLLKQSQSLAQELQSQQQELQKTNEQLQEKARLLAEQNVEVERKNQEVEQARKALEEKAEQLALTSKYKSEFLANMSHELRTPLNSLLILSDQLGRNQEGNLTPRQVEFSKTIHASGNDLLALINDILDLSKIESGTVTLDIEELSLSDLQNFVERTFRHVAESKGLDFSMRLGQGLPRTVHTDSKRLQQVLKNLLSNAFKFTQKGRVEVRVEPADGGWSPDNETLNRAKSVMAFSVIDTGIGIPPEKHQIIFEAFQQADGSTSRRYGGTGLGLAISLEISRLLGGEIRLQSAPGKGSTFTLFLARNFSPPKARKATKVIATSVPDSAADMESAVAVAEIQAATDHVADDREDIHAGDHVVLFVDNDTSFTRFLVDLAHEKGFKALATSHGSVGVALAREFKPVAITLDIRLPDIDGWQVLNKLTGDVATRHIPVHVISTEDEREHGFRRGAFDVAVKPLSKEQLDALFDRWKALVTRTTRSLLIVEDDELQRDRIVELVKGDDLAITTAGTGKEALERLQSETFDCVVLDLGLPDMPGIRLVETIARMSTPARPALIVYTARDLTPKEGVTVRRAARSVITKDARSMDQLLDETTFCLRRAHSRLTDAQRAALENMRQRHDALAERKILVVDDDIRNIFAVTSILERHKMDVRSAEDGNEAIRILESTTGTEVVLMDIMMPGMDGYETIRMIRKDPRFKALPVIAMTAKAMKGDREKCIEAGATDYIAKPVDTEQLLSMLSMWLRT